MKISASKAPCAWTLDVELHPRTQGCNVVTGCLYDTLTNQSSIPCPLTCWRSAHWSNVRPRAAAPTPRSHTSTRMPVRYLFSETLLCTMTLSRSDINRRPCEPSCSVTQHRASTQLSPHADTLTLNPTNLQGNRKTFCRFCHQQLPPMFNIS